MDEIMTPAQSNANTGAIATGEGEGMGIWIMLTLESTFHATLHEVLSEMERMR
jgi:hypothetical protein